VNGDFVWRDAGRTVLFQQGGIGAAAQLLGEHGFSSYELLSTPRALAGAPKLAAAASAVHEVPGGSVPELAAPLLDAVGADALVALGGGRVIDVAKAVASLRGARVAAIPTTMSGAEMTAIHRLPEGADPEAAPRVRPELVLADPEAMTSQPEEELRASSMNALAHGADSLYTPAANPVAEMSALRGAELIAAALDADPYERDRSGLALGSILCGYAIDSAGFGLHHVICQTLVRVCGTPHAQTNATILPRAIAFLAPRAPTAFAELAAAIGTQPDALEPRLLALAGNPPGLGALGADKAELEEAIEAMLRRPELASVPGSSLTKGDLAELLAKAWQ
jgi:alcohol dehydrogenase class IV